MEINHAIDEARCVDESRQFAHEHARAYDAVHHAANVLELAGEGHQREVALLRAICRRITQHEAAGSCDGD